MWILFSIRLETARRTAYMLGHVRWTSAEPVAIVVTINAWPSPSNQGVFFYNAFIPTYNDPDLFRFIIQQAGEENDDDEDSYRDEQETRREVPSGEHASGFAGSQCGGGGSSSSNSSFGTAGGSGFLAPDCASAGGSTTEDHGGTSGSEVLADSGTDEGAFEWEGIGRLKKFLEDMLAIPDDDDEGRPSADQ